MKCGEFTQEVHGFMDYCLGPQEMAAMNQHVSECPRCKKLIAEYSLIQHLLCKKETLSESATERLALEISRNRKFHPLVWIADRASLAWSRLRDSDHRLLWTRASALPVTICFFLSLVQQLVPVRVETLPFLVVSSRSRNSAPMVLNINVKQSHSQLNDLMDTAWRLPYEDSLTLIAQISPQGRAEIGDVLEYPRSNALFDAVDLTLRESQFEEVAELTSPLIIFSFQKIDVYENNRGL